MKTRGRIRWNANRPISRFPSPPDPVPRHLPQSHQFTQSPPHGTVDVVTDVVGGPLFRSLINLLRPEGRYITAGAFAGAVAEMYLRTICLKHLEVRGSSHGTRSAFRLLHDHIEFGRIRPNLFATDPLSAFHRAQTDFMSRGHVDKLVVMPDWFHVPA